MKQIFRGKAREQAVGNAVWGTQIIVKTGMNPRLEILKAPAGVDVRRPCDGERVHSIFIFQQMGSIKAVFSAAARYKAVITAVGFPVAVAQLAQLLLTRFPVNLIHFIMAGMTSVTNAVLLNDHRFLFGMDGVLKLIAAVGLLVAHDTLFAKAHLSWQAVKRLTLLFGQIFVVFFIINGHPTG